MLACVTLGPITLASWPTPLEPAPRLAGALRLDHLWIKRDDLTGLGGGGNKVRKLQYTCAAALEAGADHLVTTGAPQSNHARLTAAAAARLGLRCTLVLAGDPPTGTRGNLLLNALAGATVVFAGSTPPAEVAATIDGFNIPMGGTSPLGARGYADCARELLTQLPDLDTVVVALGSGGTMAGLVSALGPDRVLGVDVGALPDPRTVVTDLLSSLGTPVAPSALRVDGSQIGAGYATLTDAARAALELAARTEGLFLDPTYTARALAGLAANPLPGKVVFLHSGGLPGLFGHPALP